MSVVTQCGRLDSLEDRLTKLLRDIRDLRPGEMPHSAELRAAPFIEKWSYSFLPACCIAGSVRGHLVLGNLARVHTSALIHIDPERGWARTWSRYYRLGVPEGAASSESK
jgi:hypothetical protein